MNRQAFTFLTLFTLVLMLAVYYVTLPLENPSVITDDLIVSENITDSLDDYQKALQEKHETQIKENESILSSNDSTLQDKLAALELISQSEKTNTLEATIQSNLSSCGFNGCVVEIEDEVTRILCPNEYVGKKNAAAILQEAYRFIAEEDLIEVSFE